MSSDYFLFYTEGNIVGIALFLIMLINDIASANRQEKQVIFQRVMIVHILYFVNDIMWTGVFSGAFPYNRTAAVILCLINFILMSLIAYEWFMFAAASTGMEIRKSKRGIWLIRLPMFIMPAVMIAAYVSAPYYWLSAKGELNPFYNVVFLAAPLFYVVWASVYSLAKAAKKENRVNRKLFILIGLYPIEVVFFGILETVAVKSPLFCFGITVMMVFFYIQNMKDQISTDPLTGLNNRGQLMKYIAAGTGHHSDGTKTFVVMIDANDFKKINDTHGHAEGDHALVLIARALKEAAGSVKNQPFIGRYGGDEFIMILHTDDKEETLILKNAINRELELLCASENVPFRLTVGIGCDQWGVEDSFESCMVRADRELYKDKEQYKK